MTRPVTAISIILVPNLVLVRVIIAVMFHDQRKLGRKGFIWLMFASKELSLLFYRTTQHQLRVDS